MGTFGEASISHEVLGSRAKCAKLSTADPTPTLSHDPSTGRALCDLRQMPGRGLVPV